MVNSGSSANLLALSILTNPHLRNKRIKTGDEIITPAVTWPTTVYPISNVGAVPKFVDVNLDDFSINVDEIENSITKREIATSALSSGLVGGDDTEIKLKLNYDTFNFNDKGLLIKGCQCACKDLA